MMSFNQIMRWSWAFLVAVTLSLGLAGCEGDDGAPGATGAQGPQGDPGDPGEQGPPGTAAKVTPFESCAVCHDDNSIADAGAAHALPPIEAVSNITFGTANAGADLTVAFNLAADGVPATNYNEVQRAYFTDGTSRTDLRERDPVTLDLLPLTDQQVSLTGGAGGDYLLTVFGFGAEAANNNRWLFRVGVAGDRETRVYFYGDTGEVRVVEDLAISAAACNACHGPEGIGVHGGYFAANDGGEPCLACHGVERETVREIDGVDQVVVVDTPELFVVAHGYHSGVATWEDPLEEINVTFPTYMNNCSVCHAEEAQLTAANAMSFSAEHCFSCHVSIEGIPFPSATLAEFHAGRNDCEACHVAGGFAENIVAVSQVHNGAITERDGIIWDGVDTSVTEGAKIDWWITGVVDDGTDLTITWEASYDDIAFSPCNADPAAGPVFFADADPDADPPVDNGDNLSILRNYAQGGDFILGLRAGRVGQPFDDVDIDDTNTTCEGGGLVATTVVPAEETDAHHGRVAIQGKPRIPSIDPDPDVAGCTAAVQEENPDHPDCVRKGFVAEFGTVMPVRAKTPTYDWVIGDDTGLEVAPARRAIADTSLCLNCHVGSLYQHGGNRVDNIDHCMLCHNSAANDEYVRAGYGVDASEAYDLRAGQAFGIKEMVHGVHPAGRTGNPLVIYRGRGIYAWADDVSKLNNWPAGDWPGDIDDLPIAGSDDGEGNPVLQDHHFHIPTYPRGLYDCAACHVATVDLLPNPKVAMATTVEAGAPPFEGQLNDVLQGVQTTSCVSCHADGASKGHAYQNSWIPQAFEEGRQTIIDAN